MCLICKEKKKRKAYVNESLRVMGFYTDTGRRNLGSGIVEITIDNFDTTGTDFTNDPRYLLLTLTHR